MKELEENQDDMDRLYKDLKAQEDEAKYLDGQNVKLSRNCSQVEDDLTNSRARNRDFSMRFETVTRMRNLIEEECCGGQDDNDELKDDINGLRRDTGLRDAQLNSELRPRSRMLDKELSDCEARSEEQIREIQRTKNLYAEQLNKNADLLDDLNSLEDELARIKAETESNRTTLTIYEERKTTAYVLNKNLLSIIDELQRSIDELTVQNKDILRELEIIADQDGHVQVILNRKSEIDRIKHTSEEKVKKYSNVNQTISTAMSPQRGSNVKTSMTYTTSNVKRTHVYS